MMTRTLKFACFHLSEALDPRRHYLATFLFLFLAQSTLAAVAVDDISVATAGEDEDELTISSVDVSGADRLLIVGVSIFANDTSEAVSSITYDPPSGSDQSLTKKDHFYDSDSKYRVEIWYLVAPTTGTNGSIDVVFNEDLSKGAVAGSISFTDVDQTTPLGDFVSDADDSDTASVEVEDVEAGGMAFGVVTTKYDLDDLDPESSLTEHWDSVGFETRGAGGTEANSGATTTDITVEWDLDPEEKWAIAGVPINPAGPTAATIGDVWLDSTAIGDFIEDLQLNELETTDLAEFVSYWILPSGEELPIDANRDELLRILSTQLDQDGNGQIILLRWKTLEERGTIGFFVERSTNNAFSEDWRPLNDRMLPGLIDAPLGGEYWLVDSTAKADTSYLYRIIEQEAWGSTKTHGPYELATSFE